MLQKLWHMHWHRINDSQIRGAKICSYGQKCPVWCLRVNPECGSINVNRMLCAGPVSTFHTQRPKPQILKKKGNSLKQTPKQGAVPIMGWINRCRCNRPSNRCLQCGSNQSTDPKWGRKNGKTGARMTRNVQVWRTYEDILGKIQKAFCATLIPESLYLYIFLIVFGIIIKKRKDNALIHKFSSS